MADTAPRPSENFVDDLYKWAQNELDYNKARVDLALRVEFTELELEVGGSTTELIWQRVQNDDSDGYERMVAAIIYDLFDCHLENAMFYCDLKSDYGHVEYWMAIQSELQAMDDRRRNE